ncbi:TetR/AcrR family transcriptional regulator [Desulfovibrio psychrotolerans]|uniref:TetR family transcriptional regulator n=1 Tax=Desulfovibrio psychrotolerans TaxID=415242 RepID=A0A7J0BXL7_9BACT|nr:TetR/AcrR family transcriptional regulator [Desulfovibrio psychrotolerans]GFM37921.1 TetR family transcriptional regulator [Desulfovibrio psychrotolerans]
MSEETRQRIIETGAELIHRQGFTGTGLKEILEAAGVPKGSFYHYFKSKEAFGLAVVDHFSASFGQIFLRIARDTSLSAFTRIQTILSTFEDYFRQHGCTRGCPIGNLAQEMGGLSEPFQQHLRAAMDRMAKGFEHLIRQGQETGEIRADLDPAETAYFLVSCWHGAIIRMKVTRSADPLILCRRFFSEILLSRPVTSRSDAEPATLPANQSGGQACL